MANKRDFKKGVEALGVAALQEMTVAFHNVEGADRTAITNAISVLLAAITKARKGANAYMGKGVRAFSDHKEFAKAKTGFFKKHFEDLSNEFSKEFNASLKEFNSAIPAQVKEANKAAAN